MPKAKSAHFKRKVRTLALQALYEADVAGHSTVESMGWWFEEDDELLAVSAGDALELMEGVISQRDDIDRFIHKHAPAWPVRQVPAVDRNILRLALFEMCFGGGVPKKVAINEAVELAKTFGSESSPRFVNGVLGSVMEELEQAPEGSSAASLVAGQNVTGRKVT